ncbi:hypothetical protein Vretifemale_3228 [Volvox reticuliferus]|uniref:Uncharacterized protein n=1 Tax=Volvox reticuliferus TaxID=1737510 RepID=A0A8J4C0U0_9CHLO|nr:hypothetical protein Vretifemale_3228 [Volvox reticuliferus]
MPLLHVLPWARTLLQQAVGRVCAAHSASNSARGFGLECADDGQGPPLHKELLAALQGFPDLAFLCSLQGAVARKAKVSAVAPEPQKLGHGASGSCGPGGALAWILDGLRGAASDNLLVQALLRPPHPAAQPLANSCTMGLVQQGLLDPATLGRARNAVSGRVWRLQQQQQQEVDCTGDRHAVDGVVMLQHLLRLCACVEPAAAAVEMSGTTCDPSLPLCCSGTFQSWVVPALLFVFMIQEWNRCCARGACSARSRDWSVGVQGPHRGTRLQHVFGKWLLTGPLSGTDDEVLLRCIDGQMRRI